MSNINSNHPNFQDRAQVELMDTMHPQQQHPPPSQQEQQPVPQQFQPQYQQSFFTQPDISEQQGQGHPHPGQSYDHRAVPSNTNAVGDGTPGYHVGGVGVPGARVELMPQEPQQQQGFLGSEMRPVSPQPVPGSDALLGGQLDSVQHAYASRPHVGPFDPVSSSQQPSQHPFSSADTSGVNSFTASQIPPMGDTTSTQPTAPQVPPPSILLQRETSAQGNDLPRSYQGMTSTSSSGNNNNMSPTTSSASPEAPNNKVHIASEGAIAAAQANQAATARGRRRSSLAVFVDKIKSASRSRSRSTSLSRRLSRTLSRHSLDEEEEEVGGPYKDVKLAQQEYLAKLRADQERMGITHNADGLPIPQPQDRQRRRSSVSHILGLDKPLLSR
ncbi:hypothetical protein BGZ70_000317 [Mortierella alpina]|uniref:Uncharacterized protein n=1 Tax=Mortierella alpina TaxID=64518 RepID=A0A9P6IY27_MORAP|nr:hypothetical protein BGZ70_000317 [Mortierella alpina]